MKSYRIRKILVTTDFSALSLHALNHAERIAVRAGARITLLHVVSPQSGGYGTSGMLSAANKLEEKRQAVAAAQLRTIAAKFMARSEVKITTTARIGNIASTITKTASDIKANLIVMGTHGATGFVENMLGSSTYRVAGHSRIPVLSVHKALPRNGYNNLVYPVRDRTQAMSKYEFALAFASLFKARVHIVGLLRTNEAEDEQRMRELCSATQSRFEKDGIAVTVKYTQTGEFPVAVMKYARAYADPLVVIKQDRDFLLAEIFRGTFTKAVLHKVLSPVLTIP